MGAENPGEQSARRVPAAIRFTGGYHGAANSSLVMNQRKPADVTTPAVLQDGIEQLGKSALVLRVPLSLAEGVRVAANDLLPRTDLDRAERFAQQVDRDRHLLAWSVARLILAALLERSPRSLEFADNGYGKKHIDLPDCRLRFNISHSGDYVLVALADRLEVGVDVESMRPLPDLMAVAARFFSPAERAILQALPADRREDAFFAVWTRKEAFIKAVGMGLSLPLDAFDVSVDPDAAGRLLSVRHPGQHADFWSLSDIATVPEYRAALALGGPGAQSHRAVDLTEETLQALLHKQS